MDPLPARFNLKLNDLARAGVPPPFFVVQFSKFIEDLLFCQTHSFHPNQDLHQHAACSFVLTYYNTTISTFLQTKILFVLLFP
jgi:hypothetical protein